MSNSRLFVFDQYQKDSIKLGTTEGRIRSTCPILRVIEGGSVPLPRSWPNFLALPDNKSPPNKVVVAAGGFLDEREVQSSERAIDRSQV